MRITKNLAFGCLLLLSFNTFAERTTSITAGEMVTKVTSIRVENALGLATGVYFLYEAVQNYKSKSMGDAITSGALGLSTVLGGISFVSTAQAGELPLDVKSELQNSPEYAKIANDLGEERAEEFIFDVLAGWSVERLDAKYNLSEELESQAITNRDSIKDIDENESRISSTASQVQFE